MIIKVLVCLINTGNTLELPFVFSCRQNQNMWPQQAADKTKMWHNIMTLPGLQIFKNLSELVSE
jgi:hypothetical protein